MNSSCPSLLLESSSDPLLFSPTPHRSRLAMVGIIGMAVETIQFGTLHGIPLP